jgi:hypothetical protein
MDNTFPEPEGTQIELFSVKCRHDSVLRLSVGAASQPGCTSFLVYCYLSRQWEPDWVFLPGLYLLDDSLELLRRVSIRHDQESFVIVGHASQPVEPELVLHRFALLTLGPDGDFVKCELWSWPDDPSPISLDREQAHVLAKCAKSF